MSITQLTRRDLFDFLQVCEIPWHGRLEESAFLSRLYDLSTIPSTDNRYKDAAGDIHQHRVNNWDWDEDWVFYDARFELQNGNDEILLNFLCETMHPIVVQNPEHVAPLLDQYNKSLAADGYKLVQGGQISGRPIYTSSKHGVINVAAKTVIQNYGSRGYVQQQLSRMETAIDTDPELAIGTAKELVEGVCKTILTNHFVSYGKNDDLPKIMKLTAKALKLSRDDVPDQRPASETIKRILSNFASIVQNIAELRNSYGTGHGKASHTLGLSSRHARLASGAAATLVAFLIETEEQRKQSNASR